MKFFYDTEFIEDGSTIDLISIGIVCEDGREYYAQSCEFHAQSASDWVVQNVFPSLHLCSYASAEGSYITPLLSQISHHTFRNGGCRNVTESTFRRQCPWRTREQLADEIRAFIDESPDKPELWGYYSAYDHVALCQLFGPMISLPKGWPMYTRDLKQWCDALGNPRLPKQANEEHNALSDARHNKVMWHFLKGYSNSKEA